MFCKSNTCIFTTELLVDVTEELDYTTVRYPTFRAISDPLTDSSACIVHEELSKVIREDIDPTTLETQNVRQKALAVQLRKAMDMDPEAPAMIEMLRTYLATFDNVSGHFTNIEEYVPHRIANCGYWYVSCLSA